MSEQATFPFRQFILKVHSRCDLACNHCYMYEGADQSWLSRPKVMSLETAERIGGRIADHARRHDVSSVRLILHGGEPLLAGVGQLEGIILRLSKVLDGITADIRVHTNAVRLDERFLDLFVQHDVRVGVSLDGDRLANDRHRLYADGRTSHPQVRAALALLRRPEYEHLYSGILCTVDIANDPIAVYEALLAESPPRIGLLLPHATWDVPPPRPLDPGTGAPHATAYADWLIAIFDRWRADGRPMGIRIFDSVLSTLHGGPPLSEALGLAPSDLVVIETDGEIEQLDSLKVAFDGAPKTGLTVADDDLDLALAHPGMRARQSGLAGLSEQCRSCEVVESCGGGLFPHRYRSESGFDNPSVYCDDLKKLILHIERSDRRRPGRGPASATRHRIADAQLAELASGFGGAAAVTALMDVQASIARGLLATVAEQLAMRDSSARTAWNALIELDRTQPTALAAVLAQPYFRTWAHRVLSEGVRDHDAYRLSALALAVAVHAGTELELTLHAEQGAIYLPRLGTLSVPGPSSYVRVATTAPNRLLIGTGPDRFVVTLDAETPSGLWETIRTLHSEGFTIRLDDGDPERDCYGWPATSRLPAADHDRWQRSFDVAWRLILADHPGYAPGLAAGLSTVTPLKPAPAGRAKSATARQAPGAVGAALPDGPELLALLLLHEFQHVKLGAVLDAYDLYDESDRRSYYAPWRDDPRPIEGLLQGTYAHLTVTDFWRVQRLRAVGETAETAEVNFARWRLHTAEAIEVLAASGSLTELGRQFTDSMRATVAPWLAEPVGSQAERAARGSAERHFAAYRRRADHASDV